MVFIKLSNVFKVGIVLYLKHILIKNVGEESFYDLYFDDTYNSQL